MPYPKSVNRTITINAPPSDVWQALTDPGLLREWRSPDKASTVTAEWRTGGPIVFEGTWDRRKYLDRGTILAFDPHKTLSYNIWSKLSRPPRPPRKLHRRHLQSLTPNETGTTLTLTHTNFQS